MSDEIKNEKSETDEQNGKLSNNQLDKAVGAGGWGMAQYQYGFEGTYSSDGQSRATATDDVIVDGRIITAENYDS